MLHLLVILRLGCLILIFQSLYLLPQLLDSLLLFDDLNRPVNEILLVLLRVFRVAVVELGSKLFHSNFKALPQNEQIQIII